MNHWLTRVLVAVREDLLRERWWFLAYVLLIAAAFAMLALWPPARGEFEIGFTVFFLQLTGIVLFIRLVQRDLRLLRRNNANDVTEPSALAPAPVDALPAYGARLFTMLLFAVLPQIVQYAALRELSVPRAELPGLLPQSTSNLIVLFAVLGVVASLTTGFGWMLLALISLSVAGNGMEALRKLVGIDETATFGAVETFAAEFILTAIAALLMFHQYRTRNLRIGAIIAVSLFAVMQVVPPPHVRVASSHSQSSATLPDSLRPSSLELRAEKLHAVSVPRDRGWLDMRAEIVVGLSAPQYRHLLRVHSMRLRLANGSYRNVTPPSAGITLFDPVPELPSGVKWMGEVPKVESERNFPFTVTASQRKILEEGSAVIEIRGELELLVPRIVELPMRKSAGFERPGARTSVTIVGNLLERQSIMLKTIAVGQAADRYSTKPRWHQFVLVNKRLGEATLVNDWSTDKGTSGLPLAVFDSTYFSHGLFPHEDADWESIRKAGPSWLEDAQLAVVDWVSLGAYPVRLEGRVIGVR